jgi:hypothetical protein
MLGGIIYRPPQKIITKTKTEIVNEPVSEPPKEVTTSDIIGRIKMQKKEHRMKKIPEYIHSTKDLCKLILEKQPEPATVREIFREMIKAEL